MSMNRIRRSISICTKCNVDLEKSSFFGNQYSSVLFVGQNPGLIKMTKNPDNVPFGLHDFNEQDKASGDILKNMFRLNGIYDFAITNLVKCPIEMSDEHINNCMYWLRKEINMMPALKIICCLGKYAGKAFGISIFGREKQLYGEINVIMIHHPGYFRRNPSHIELYEYEFVRLKEIINEKV